VKPGMSLTVSAGDFSSAARISFRRVDSDELMNRILQSVASRALSIRRATSFCCSMDVPATVVSSAAPNGSRPNTQIANESPVFALAGHSMKRPKL
jgi:hypothetical protein